MPKKKDFATMMSELEQIVSDMEHGNLGLEQALQQFEQGVQLSKQCQQLLQTAEVKIEALMKDGKTLEKFDIDHEA